MSEIFNLAKGLVCLAQATGVSLDTIQFVVESCWNHFEWVEQAGFSDEEVSRRIKLILEKGKEGR